MSSQSSLYLRQYILEHVLMHADNPSPTDLYLALFTEDPTPAGTGQEVTGDGYERMEVTWALLSGRVDAAGNSNNITFPEALADWGLVTHWGVMDDVTEGNLLYFGQATLARDSSAGSVLLVPPNNTLVDLSGDVPE